MFPRRPTPFRHGGGGNLRGSRDSSHMDQKETELPHTPDDPKGSADMTEFVQIIVRWLEM